MAGWDEKANAEEEIRFLRAQISELEKRRNNIQKEIQEFYQRYKNELDAEYNKLRLKLEEDAANRTALMDKRDRTINARENELTSKEATTKAEQDALISTLRTKIQEADNNRILLQRAREKLEEEYAGKFSELAIEKNKIRDKEESLRQEKQNLITIQQNVLSIEQRNKETEARLAKESEDIKKERQSLEYFSAVNKKKEKDLSGRESAIKEDEIQIDNQKRETARLLEESRLNNLKSEDLLVNIKAREAKLDKKEKEQKKLSEYLQNLQNNLNERELTVSEKERYLTLKTRTVDEKIKILQELRAAEVK